AAVRGPLKAPLDSVKHFLQKSFMKVPEWRNSEGFSVKLRRRLLNPRFWQPVQARKNAGVET
ncbi:hypothetical protein, partial [Novosphingobium indicum]|uniref:hypothetical protein n=1 Tax=Novosphingobium indicum TaxID=462949 RepID=UPI001E5E2F2D